MKDMTDEERVKVYMQTYNASEEKAREYIRMTNLLQDYRKKKSNKEE